MKDRFASLEGRTILYTGAAGGLGQPTVIEMLGQGARVVVLDNDATKIAALQAAAGNVDAERLVIEKCDLSDLDGLARRLDGLADSVGGFDVVINNAAIYPAKPFEDFTIAEIQMVQRVNVDSGIVCVQAALPHMKRKGWGRIINISSITFSGGWENLTPYVQSKGALIALARSWAREFGKYGITANAVSPGAFPTDAEKIHADPEGYARFVLDHQAIKRRGTPQDMAGVLMFLASEASGFVTGQTINVDGGWVMT
ncbi:SDR family oxidoreductase [Pelagibacterium sp. 26DY04]|uniref:SDR family NAD(P)-dependent oxidoreductase n=1 Tax=Pelagibacterium sp. 26DY04 TaxID=2967130 RepID=UPI0028167944|nr:SDR family oxidoreductase [Pelagibacterium sp. 26DY04]WMT85906.1 SDR family oxidoreductase [Pelagibacterium sp. 26DY04]